MDAVLAAALDVARAELAAKQEFRPLARESAARQAQAANDCFIAARLDAWRSVLNTKPAQVAG